ncbi:MAG: hypothetical protein MUP41_13400, partial [Desulfobacterales bacterium]|nr:hypothetical protein [Desulfobacterales bacterium]
GEVKGIGNAQVHHLDRWIIQEVAVVVIYLGDAVASGELLGAGLRLACKPGNFDGYALDLMIGAKVEGRCKPCAYNSDADGFTHGVRSFLFLTESKRRMKDYEFKLKAWIPFVKGKDFRRRMLVTLGLDFNVCYRNAKTRKNG